MFNKIVAELNEGIIEPEHNKVVPYRHYRGEVAIYFCDTNAYVCL